VLDVHWAGSNNGEYAGLDMAGFDQTVSALRNSGISGNAAAITNSGSTLSTLTLNQTVDTVYAGTIGGAVSVVKAGGGRLTLVHPTHHTGDTAIQGGTLELGANNVLSSQSAVVLSGGQLALGATTNTLASLTVTADSTLDLGEGQAVFAAQTPDVWEGTLTLTGAHADQRAHAALADPGPTRIGPVSGRAGLAECGRIFDRVSGHAHLDRITRRRAAAKVGEGVYFTSGMPQACMADNRCARASW
ncbi:MAG: hypothetical protein GX748_14565, partial [Lentisphaerae bacterium]|nr:hypothetical protein [Lentisphaerota bacterium]